MTEKQDKPKQKICVFQQKGSGQSKIKGIERMGDHLIELKTCNIDQPLPELIEDSSDILPQDIDADLVLDYLDHPDLSHDLGLKCSEQNIPVISSGKKSQTRGVFTPPTCCGLPRRENLGAYGKLFGLPRLQVSLKEDKIEKVHVLRGAPCGATWEAARKIIGMDVQEAARQFGLELQYCCTADPANWDPLFGHSPVHFAAEVHQAALKQAIKQAQKEEGDS